MLRNQFKPRVNTQVANKQTINRQMKCIKFKLQIPITNQQQSIRLMDSRQTNPYGQKDLIYPTSHQTISNTTHTYYPISDQLEYVQSRIVTQNNSSLVSAINLNPNKLSLYQRSGQSEHQFQTKGQQTHGGIWHNTHGTHQLGSNPHQMVHQLSRPGSNKITALGAHDSSSLVGSTQRNQEQSLTKRPGSVNRGGIKVVSRNSSMQRKSQTSVQKSITSKDLNLGNTDHNNKQKSSSIGLCGMNCTTRSPFTQNQQTHQMTVVPKLGSLQTLQSGITSSHLPYSQRQHPHKHHNPSQQQLNKHFYDNISQRTHISPSQNYIQKNNSQLMKENMSMNSNMDKVYKQVREMMEKQITVAKKMYEKKYTDEIQCLNAYYKSQVQTLQRVLAENLTTIQEQGTKITKLQDRIHKKQAKAEKYSQKFDYLIKFIDKSNKFALQRIDEVQRKFILLLSEFQSFHLSPSDSIALQNKLTYLQQIFSSVVVKTIIKYRSVQWEIKEQVKQMMKKYDYYEEKIYQMDLMKHLGKENQIQNYRLIENIQAIKDKLLILESKANIRSEIRQLSHGIAIGDKANHTSNTQTDNNAQTMKNAHTQTMRNVHTQTMRNVHKVEQLKRVISTMEYKLGNLQQESTQTSIKMYKLQAVKTQLQNKLTILDNQLINTKREFTSVRTQKDQLLTQRDQLLTQREHLLEQRYKNQSLKTQQLLKSPQKPQINTNAYKYDISSQKKSVNDYQQPSRQVKQLKRQVQRLQQIIQQYQAKIQQLHDAIHNLEKENTVLITVLNTKKANEEKERQRQRQREKERERERQTQKQRQREKDNQTINKKHKQLQQEEQQQSSSSALIQKLTLQLKHKQQHLQQLESTIQQLNRQKQQLQQALQTTENIFDQQISKFKQTIRVLQQQNSQLLTQINELRQGQHQLGESSSSTKSYGNSNNVKKLTLAKSPKKEMCETVTMGWFKKSVSGQQQQKRQQQMHKQQQYVNRDGNSYRSISSNDNNRYISGKCSPSNMKQTNLSSPINQYYMEITNNNNNYNKHCNTSQPHYSENIKQYSNNNTLHDQAQSHPQVDEFFYPQSINNNNNLTSRRSIDSTSIMQSQPNISPYYPSQTTTMNSFNSSRQQQNTLNAVKTTNSKLSTETIINRYDNYVGSYDRYEQYSSQEQQENYQQEQTDTYIF